MDNRDVLFFDIDNCVCGPDRTSKDMAYQRTALSTKYVALVYLLILTSTLIEYDEGKKVHEMMSQLIDQYFRTHLELSADDAKQLHQTYYTQYGLAIEGLVRHHKIDALEYNQKVDDALPLETVLSPDAQLRAMLEDLDTAAVKPWLFTNAYVTHGKRVVNLLGIEDLFEGITYSDYGAMSRGEKMLCKPTAEAYHQAMEDASVKNVGKCFFIDDSFINCKGAAALGWTAIHLVESADLEPPSPASQHQIRQLSELPSILPDFFKSTRRV